MCTAQFIVAITGTAASADNIAAQRAAIAFVCICMFFYTSCPSLLPKGRRRRRKGNRGVFFFFFFYLIDTMLTKGGFLDIFFFACSWGPVAWVVTGELYSLNVRAKCLSMTTATNWYENPLHELIFWKKKKNDLLTFGTYYSFALQVTQLCNCKYISYLLHH